MSPISPGVITSPMQKTIRPGRSAYLPLGMIAAGLVALWTFTGIYRGWQTGAWQPILIVVGLYSLWCAALWRRVLVVSDEGLTCTYLAKKPKRVSWGDVQRSAVTYWRDRRPFQILVFGASSNPLLDIPLSLFDAHDVDFLLSLPELKIPISRCDPQLPATAEFNSSHNVPSGVVGLNEREFVNLVDGLFAERLADLGFAPDGAKCDGDRYYCRRFRAGQRYVSIEFHLYLEDGSPEGRLILGEGSNDWPESDWNAIALWRLRGKGGNYPLPGTDKLGEVLAQMRDDLFPYASDFLSGDTSRFIRARAAQNSEREPYKIYGPQKDGSFQPAIDVVSQKLKERFSK